MKENSKPNCQLCGMPLDSRHTPVSCQTNQMLFDISMGMHDSKLDKKEEDNDKKDNTESVVASCILIAIIAYFIIF